VVAAAAALLGGAYQLLPTSDEEVVATAWEVGATQTEVEVEVEVVTATELEDELMAELIWSGRKRHWDPSARVRIFP